MGGWKRIPPQNLEIGKTREHMAERSVCFHSASLGTYIHTPETACLVLCIAATRVDFYTPSIQLLSLFFFHLLFDPFSSHFTTAAAAIIVLPQKQRCTGAARRRFPSRL